ncbi:MAG: DUF58 domain-containing protein, partial [Pyrinomonadaceae bacterium]
RYACGHVSGMNLKLLKQLFSLRDLRNGVLGVVVLFGGLGLAMLMVYAHQIDDTQLAAFSAVASLVFVLLLLIFVVPPLARNAGKEASQMNLPFEFTMGGAIMFGLVVIVGFSAWNTRNNLLFLILSLLAAAIFVGFFAGSSVLKRLDVKMRFPETIFAGEETQILVSLQNRKRLLPSYSVLAEVRGTEREQSLVADELSKILPKSIADRLSRPPVLRRTLNYFVYVPRKSAVEEKITHVFENRGRFLIKDFELSTRFPFGFFRHRRRLPARETELIVFPKLAEFDHDLEDLVLESGRLVANRRGLGQDLLALRDYQPNDDLRRIDWKATARSRSLTVREFAAEDDRRFTIFFDTRMATDDSTEFSLREKIEAEQSETGDIRSEGFEHGVSVAAALLTRFSEDQADLRLFIDGAAGEKGSGTRHLYNCLKQLAAVEANFCDATDASGAWELPESFDGTLDETHTFLVTSINYVLPPELTEKLRVIRY